MPRSHNENIRTHPFRPGFRVARITRLAHLHTTPPGIEGLMRPFDFAVLTHTNEFDGKREEIKTFSDEIRGGFAADTG